MMADLTALELCAGAGGQAIGLEEGGFEHVALVEIETAPCNTLRLNRPAWNVIEADVRAVRGRDFRGIDLLAAGVPCPPFSIAGKRLGRDDDRDLFPEAIRLARESRPAAVILENVPGFGSSRFASYRAELKVELEALNYRVAWQVLQASDFGVSQLRPRFVLVALRPAAFRHFRFPGAAINPMGVGDRLRESMGANGWPGANAWADRARGIAPTIVGGSKKHGGPDLGPTRAKRQWAAMGVDALGIADVPPGIDFPFEKSPRLTVGMVARLQGFPETWQLWGRKTAAYRQVGNAFPPPVAAAVAQAVNTALRAARRAARIPALQKTA